MDHHHYQLTDLPHQKPHTCCVEGTWGGEADTWREYTCHPEHRLVSVLSFTVSYCLLSGWRWGCRGWDTESWKFFSQMFPFLSQQGKSMAPAAFSQTLWCSLTCPLPFKAVPSCTWSHTSHRSPHSASFCELGVQYISNNKTTHAWKQTKDTIQHGTTSRCWDHPCCELNTQYCISPAY